VLAADRRYRILERVAEQETIHVAELAESLGVSEMTIRRDIRRLERDGFLRRTYGGAIAHVTRSLELAFNARALEHAAQKRLIGIQAAQLIGDAMTLFAGIGTTVEQFALFLPRRGDLTVITGSLPVASLLGSRSTRVVVLGGAVRSDELSCTGPIPLATIARYQADLAVVSGSGLSARSGLTELFDEEAEIHRQMAERSRTVMVLADGSKLGETSAAVVLPTTAIDILVTDESAEKSELEALRQVIPRVVVACPGPSEAG
jgi:DeoR family transcriptional regulator, fructose operon transcriptional repressor